MKLFFERSFLLPASSGISRLDTTVEGRKESQKETIVDFSVPSHAPRPFARKEREHARPNRLTLYWEVQRP